MPPWPPSCALLECLFLLLPPLLCVAYSCAVVDKKDHTRNPYLPENHPLAPENHPLAPENQQGPRPKRRFCRPPAQRRRAAAPPVKLQTRLQRPGQGLGEGITETLLKSTILPKVVRIYLCFNDLLFVLKQICSIFFFTFFNPSKNLTNFSAFRILNKILYIKYVISEINILTSRLFECSLQV